MDSRDRCIPEKKRDDSMSTEGKGWYLLDIAQGYIKKNENEKVNISHFKKSLTLCTRVTNTKTQIKTSKNYIYKIIIKNDKNTKPKKV